MAVKHSLLDKLGVKYCKHEAKQIKKPFLLLGYGINAYFDLLQQLVYMFLMITLFSLPIYYLY